MADRIADDNDFMEVEIDAFEETEIHIQNIIKETDRQCIYSRSRASPLRTLRLRIHVCSTIDIYIFEKKKRKEEC